MYDMVADDTTTKLTCNLYNTYLNCSPLLGSQYVAFDAGKDVSLNASGKDLAGLEAPESRVHLGKQTTLPVRYPDSLSTEIKSRFISGVSSAQGWDAHLNSQNELQKVQCRLYSEVLTSNGRQFYESCCAKAFSSKDLCLQDCLYYRPLKLKCLTLIRVVF